MEGSYFWTNFDIPQQKSFQGQDETNDKEVPLDQQQATGGRPTVLSYCSFFRKLYKPGRLKRFLNDMMMGWDNWVV